jgi:ABC-2 type transport system permease protein
MNAPNTAPHKAFQAPPERTSTHASPQSNRAAAFVAFLALVRKDLLIYLGNRRTLLVNLAAPILMAAFFGYVFSPGATKKPMQLPIAVVDLDGSVAAVRFADALAKDDAVKLTRTSEAEAVSLVRAGKLRAAIVIPKGFTDTAVNSMFRPLSAGVDARPKLTVHVDPSQSFISGIVNGLISRHLIDALWRGAAERQMSVSTSVTDSAVATDAVDTERQRALNGLMQNYARLMALNVQNSNNSVAAASANTQGAKLPFVTETREVSSGVDQKYNSFAHSFAGMSVQFVLFMGIEFGIGLLLMRRMGLWTRLRAAPITATQIVTSRVVAGALISVVLITLIYAAAVAIFGVRISGSILGFATVVLAFSLFTASFGLMIAAIGRTPEASRWRVGALVRLPRVAANRRADHTDPLGD